ncbi:hypothetical protein ACFX5Q_05380 [Mesorhizobium sp. IMUNJ 23033]|uniref:hypothetical protein n=1 Tax=Mesorhizobium sp. IMUNJ 23033 TaxID=3378039 RepID=UPI00384EA71C
MTREHRGIDIGHEVTIGVTILELLDNGRASGNVPTDHFPFLIDAPKKAKPSHELDLTRHVTRVDDEDGKVIGKVRGARGRSGFPDEMEARPAAA